MAVLQPDQDEAQDILVPDHFTYRVVPENHIQLQLEAGYPRD